MRLSEFTSDSALLEELGGRLEQHRLTRNLTQAELAREAGVSKRTIERIESEGNAQLGSLIRILRALGLSSSIDSLVPKAPPSPLVELELQRLGQVRKRASRKGRVASPMEKWKWGDDR